MIANIIGPSGSGKTKLTMYLFERYPDYYRRVLSYTSRKIRENELDGIDYYYVNNSFFVTNHDLILKRECNDGFYAIKKDDLINNDDKVTLTTFPARGVLKLENLGFIVKSFFLSVNEEECKRRMEQRGDDDVSIYNRLNKDKLETSLESTVTVLKNHDVCILDGHQSIADIANKVHTKLFV